MGTGGSFTEVKRPEREDDHSPPTSAEVKKSGLKVFENRELRKIFGSERYEMTGR
jgi:hypothetical protein